MAEDLPAVSDTQRMSARVAGWAYLIPVVIIVYANFGLRGPLIVSGDVAETLRRMAVAETRFRVSIVFDVAYCVGVAVLLSALYTILRPIGRYAATLAAVLKLLYAGTAVITPITLLAQFRLASDPALAQGLGAESLHALARLISSLWWPEYYIGLAFWSLSATLFAWLWLKSRYIPRPLAIFGVVASAWCVLCTFVYLVSPNFSNVVNAWWFDSPMLIFEIAVGLWLLIRGLAVRKLGSH